MSDSPAIAVILPVFNGAEMLSECLEALTGQEEAGLPWQTVVVDNGSADPSREVAQSHGVKVVTEAKQGAYAARNRGIKDTDATHFAFVDADCIPSRTWVRDVGACIREDNQAIHGGPILSYPPKTHAEAYLCDIRMVDQEKAYAGYQLGIPFFVTANVVYPRRVFDEVGLFDEDLWIAGDADMAWRAQDNGHVLRSGRATVFHHHRETPRMVYNQHYQYGYGWVEVVRKNASRFEDPFYVFETHEADIWRDLWKALSSLSTPARRRRHWFDALSKLGHLHGALAACKALGVVPRRGKPPLEARSS